MDEYEDAAHSLGQGIRNLRDLIDAERERQEVAGDASATGERGSGSDGSDCR
jgi:hypothetical protein